MQDTYKFVQMAQELVRLIKAGKVSNKFLDMYEPFSKGTCFVCKKTLIVIRTVETGAGFEYQFKCGHSLTMITLGKAEGARRDGTSNSRVGINDLGKHDVEIKRIGPPLMKEEDEMAVAKLFCHQKRKDLKNFRHDIESSPYDIIAESESGDEYFQITRLQDEKFWSELARLGHIKTVIPEIDRLVKSALDRKSKYPEEQRRKIVLLIDAEPGILEPTALEIRESLAQESNSDFKEVWLVGSTGQLTHRIL